MNGGKAFSWFSTPEAEPLAEALAEDVGGERRQVVRGLPAPLAEALAEDVGGERLQVRSWFTTPVA